MLTAHFYKRKKSFAQNILHTRTIFLVMKGSQLVICLLAALLGVNTAAACSGELAAFYRYWKGSVTDHFYTTNVNEIGTATYGRTGRFGYISEGTQCLVYVKKIPGTVPLYRYWNGRSSDHFYTTNAKEIGTTAFGKIGNHGYKSEGIAGYCFPYAAAGTVPLFRYYKSSGSDHFYTTNIAEIGVTKVGKTGNFGYRYEGIACYVIAFYG